MMETLLLKSTEHDVGGLSIARALPQRQKRTIGAWCFLDHMGPVHLKQGDAGMKVGSHPHTNLQTFTWMLSGKIIHNDSLGHHGVITQHEVNLMTAGRGIAHTEESTDDTQMIEAVQLWIALPKNQNIEPSFKHYPDLPKWSKGSAQFVLTTGQFDGHQSETLQYSPVVGVDIVFQADDTIQLTLEKDFEYGVFVLSGEANISQAMAVENELIYLPSGNNELTLTASKDTHLLLIGGVPLDYEPVIWWNFVAANKDEIAQASIEWNQHSARFGEVKTNLPRLVAPEVPWKVPS